MAWRLGTWRNESLFIHFDELLHKAEQLPDWAAEASLLRSADFSDFWSLVWQLQMAEYLCRIGSDVRWAKSGPDLSAQLESEKWFIECYTYRKSFGLMSFVEEVLQRVDSSISVDYDYCLRFSLPANKERSDFLDQMLSPFLDQEYVGRVKRNARKQYPVVLRKHEDSSLVIYMDGEDPNTFMPGIIRDSTGDPQKYLENAVKEAVDAKRDANSLGTHRPNLVAVNYLLSGDAQLALDRAHNLRLSLPDTQLGPSIDAVAIAAVGIDARLERSVLRRIASSVSNSQDLDLMTVPE